MACISALGKWGSRLAIALGCVFWLASPAWAGEGFKLHAQLIWGTNDEKPKNGKAEDAKSGKKDGKCREIDPKLRDRLSSVFKWKNYFEVKAEDFTVKPGERRRVRMSEKCELEVVLVDDFTLEVGLFGEDKPAKRVRQSLQAFSQGEIAVLAGDIKEKYGDAWFVVLSAPKK